MKINENQKIIGQKIILVPYEASHVPKYHKWMEDEEIRRLTGSERLLLEEEYEMQKNWRDSDDKLTFIILDKSKFDENCDEIECMIGDVNLFIDQDNVAEVEIMLGEPDARGKGIASEAVSTMICYATQELNLFKFCSKISDDNEASIHLFEKKLHFKRVSYSSAFKEHTLELESEKLEHFKNYLKATNGSIVPYRN